MISYLICFTIGIIGIIVGLTIGYYIDFSKNSVEIKSDGILKKSDLDIVGKSKINPL